MRLSRVVLPDMARTDGMVCSPTSVCSNAGGNEHGRICAGVSRSVSFCQAVSGALTMYATCSLGDRHGENILFDSTTGDTLHVDFNCLFEKVSP